MNIACSSCPAKYAVPDEKVRGRKVRITCKRCGAAIVVDGTQLSAEASKSERGRQTTILGGLQAPPDSAPGAPVSQPPPKAAEKPAVAAEPPQPAAPKPASGVAAQESTWTVAVTDDDHQEMTTKQVVEAYVAKTIDAETYVWRDGMDDWLTAFEIPEIAAALKAKGLSAPTEGSGGWHEPGRWDSDGKDQVNFDDVTVAMAAPKAQALLEAVSAEDAAARAADKATPAAAAAITSETLGFSFDSGTSAEAKAPVAKTIPKPAAAEKKEAKPAADVAAAPRPKVEPGKVELAKIELAKKEVAKVDAKPEAAKLEVAKLEPVKTEPAKVEAAKPEVKKEPAKAEFPKPEAAKPEAAALEAAPAEKTDVSAAEAPAASVDLFAPAARAEAESEPPPPRARMASAPEAASAASLTGARNESSVLFSLDQLTATKPKPKAKAPTRDKTDEEALLLGGSADKAPPSVANLGGGALFAQTATMAAPDVMAPPPVSAPSRPAPAPSTAPAEKKSGSKSGLFIVVGLLAIGGGVAAFTLMKPAPAPAPSPSVTAEPPAAVETAPPSTAATAPAAVESAAPAESAAPTAQGVEAAPSAAAPSAAPALPPAATGAPGTPPPPTTATPKATQTPATPKPATTAPPAEKPQAEGPEFDREAASSALSAAAAQAQGECSSQEGTHGTGKVQITFATSGRATQALVSGDFAGSALGGCVARVFRAAKVPAFSGDPVRVTKTVRIP